MAALTADAPLRILGTPFTHKFILDTSAAQTVFKGEALVVDQSADATGPLVACHDSTHPVVAATDVFMGIAAEGKVVAAGAAETLLAAGITAYIEPTIVGFKSAVFTNGADNGKTVYMTDSSTLGVTAADNPMIGTLQFVEDGYAYVKLITAICSGA